MHISYPRNKRVVILPAHLAEVYAAQNGVGMRPFTLVTFTIRPKVKTCACNNLTCNHACLTVCNIERSPQARCVPFD